MVQINIIQTVSCSQPLLQGRILSVLAGPQLLERSLLMEGEEGEVDVESPDDVGDDCQHHCHDQQSSQNSGCFVTSSSPSERGGTRGGGRGGRGGS